jgi:hypothetical protein
MSYKKLLVMRKLKSGDIPEAESVAEHKKRKKRSVKLLPAHNGNSTYRLLHI